MKKIVIKKNFEDFEMNFLNDIPIYQLIVTYLKSGKIRLPRFKGNLIRGILGDSLKDLYCIYEKNTNCSTCIKKYECKFANIFQGILNNRINKLPDKYKKYSNLPSMFVIDEIYDNFNFLNITINFIGDLQKYFEVLLKMFINVKKFRPDKYSKGRLLLYSIKNNERNIYLDDELLNDHFEKAKLIKIFRKKIILNFITPTRITFKGKLVMDNLNNHILQSHIFERSLLLMLLYTKLNNFPTVIDNGINLIGKELIWKDIKHNSNRQKERIKLGGFKGKIVIQIEDKNIIPYLRIAEKMHIGTNAKAGYGKFKIL